MNHQITWREESKYEKTRREGYTFLLGIVVRWVVTLFFLGFIVFVIIPDGWEKSYIIPLLISGGLAGYSWYVEYYLIKKHKRKYGKNWKWYKEPLFKEVIAIIILISLFLYLL